MFQELKEILKELQGNAKFVGKANPKKFKEEYEMQKI